MPKLNFILNLPGFTLQRVSGYDPIIFDVNYRRKPHCPHCHSTNLRKKDKSLRIIAHEAFGHRRSQLRFIAYKFFCRQCARYFNQQFPGIGKYQRATERLKEQLCKQHLDGICQKTLAQNFKVGTSTIERWYHRFFHRAHQERINRPCPRILGLDEHRFGKRHKFVTTFCNLANHRIFDIANGRSKASLHDYLNKLSGRDRVKVVCIDLSASYKNIVREYFPKALIVADRFHVIRLLNHQTMATLQQLDENIKYQRGILAALRTNPQNLTTHKQTLLDNYFQVNPAAKAVYDFKQHIYQLLMLKGCNPSYCKQLLPKFLDVIKQLKNSSFKNMKTLGKTLYQWREEIVRMWRFSRNNGITEGFHRKMKLIQRRAYGFRSFDNYRLRVRALCG